VNIVQTVLFPTWPSIHQSMYINTHICKHTHINTRTPAHT